MKIRNIRQIEEKPSLGGYTRKVTEETTATVQE
jgi:hypothetical protein